MLAKKNTHTLDANITFEPLRHRYLITAPGVATRSFQSVTSFVKSNFAPFDSATALAGAKRGNNPKYVGKSDKQILREWADSGKEAAALGTELHAEIEAFYNASDMFEWMTDDESDKPERRQFTSFWEDHKDTLEPYRTEWAVYDVGTRLAGSMDMVFRNREGKYFIYDWKRTKPFRPEDYFGRNSTTPCLLAVPDTKFWHYSLQLNTYKTIIERGYGIRIDGMFLVRFHPTLEDYEKISVPCMAPLMRNLFAERTTTVASSQHV